MLYLNTDWGRASQNIFAEAAKAYGVDVVASEGYQPDEKDFRSTLVRVRDAKPDGDRADLLLRRWRADLAPDPHGRADDADRRERLDLFAEIHRTGRRRRATASSPKSNFFPGDTAPGSAGLRRRNSRRKYNEEPDDFNAVAYDTIILLAAVIDKYGPDRTAIRDGLAQIKDVPSVIYGKATFDPQTRRVAGARAVYLVVKDGKFVLWDGKKPTAT